MTVLIHKFHFQLVDHETTTVKHIFVTVTCLKTMEWPKKRDMCEDIKAATEHTRWEHALKKAVCKRIKEHKVHQATPERNVNIEGQAPGPIVGDHRWKFVKECYRKEGTIVNVNCEYGKAIVFRKVFCHDCVTLKFCKGTKPVGGKKIWNYTISGHNYAFILEHFEHDQFIDMKDLVAKIFAHLKDPQCTYAIPPYTPEEHPAPLGTTVGPTTSAHEGLPGLLETTEEAGTETSAVETVTEAQAVLSKETVTPQDVAKVEDAIENVQERLATVTPGSQASRVLQQKEATLIQAVQKAATKVASTDPTTAAQLTNLASQASSTSRASSARIASSARLSQSTQAAQFGGDDDWNRENKYKVKYLRLKNAMAGGDSATDAAHRQRVASHHAEAVKTTARRQRDSSGRFLPEDHHKGRKDQSNGW